MLRAAIASTMVVDDGSGYRRYDFFCWDRLLLMSSPTVCR